MRQANLSAVKGTQIENRQWNLNPTQILLSYGGLNLIYVAEITPNQHAIVHWADVENDDANEDEYTRALVIPMPQETILEIASGATSMRETYLNHRIFIIDGLAELSEGIAFTWTDCDKDFLEEYLPVPDHKLTDE